MGYCERYDIEARYGSETVSKWADANSNQDASEIAARITLAIDNATAFIEDALRGGPHEIPLTTPFPSGLPRTIIDIAAKLAGYDLVSHRGVADQTDENVTLNRLSGERQDAMASLDKIMTGRLTLDDVKALGRAPAVVAVETSKDDD